MTNLTNQLRAALYLASRNAYVKGAFALPALLIAWMAAAFFLSGGTAQTTYELVLANCLSAGVVFGAPFAALGIAAHDRGAYGLRAAVVAEGGRTGYVAARVLLAGMLVAALALWSSAVSLVALALPGVRVDGTPVETLALLILVRLLVGWAYAVVCLAITAVAHGMGGNVVLAAFVTAGGIRSLVEIAFLMLFSWLPLDVPTAGVLGVIEDASLASLIQSFAAPEPLRFVALPLVYLALAAALFHVRTARRSL